jgi:hypothetical protein
MPFENENQVPIMRGGDRCNGCRVRLANSKFRNGKEYVRPRAPFLDCLALNADFRHTAFESCQCSLTRSDIVPYVSHRSNHPIQQVKSYRDVNVNPRVQSCTWKMHHNSNDESKERDNVLNHEEFIGKVPDWCYCADIHPNQNCIHCPASRDT